MTFYRQVVRAGGTVLSVGKARSPRSRVRSYFFAFWKDADPDIPILKQAKAEYAKLQ